MATLRRKLWLTTAIVLGLLVGVGFAVGTLVSSEVERAVLERVEAGVGSTVQRQASVWLRPADFQAAGEEARKRFDVLLGELGHPDVTRIAVWGPGGEQIYGDGGPSPSPSDAPRLEMLSPLAAEAPLAGVDVPIVLQGQRAGVIRATTRMDGARREIEGWRTLTWGSMAITVGLLFGLFLILQMFLSRSVLKPLDRLRRAAEEVGRGNLRACAEETPGDEIGQLASSFNQMVGELQRAQEARLQSEKLAAIGTLAAGVAHEINNPLTSILAYAATLRSRLGKRLSKDFAEPLAGIEEASRRSAQIVQGLLDYSRAPRLQRSPVVVKELIEKTLQDLRQRLEENIQLQVETPREECVLQGDPGELQEVIENLIVNAVEAMPRGGTLKIAATQANGEVVLTVSDTGPGIQEENHTRIFEPFYTTKPHGVGLGLAIVHRIVENHGGHIGVESPPEGGTTIRVLLPREVPAAPPPPAVPPAPAPEPLPAPSPAPLPPPSAVSPEMEALRAGLFRLDGVVGDLRLQMEQRLEGFREEEVRRFAGEISSLKEESARTRLAMENLPLLIARELGSAVEKRVEVAVSQMATRETQRAEEMRALEDRLGELQRVVAQPPPPPIDLGPWRERMEKVDAALARVGQETGAADMKMGELKAGVAGLQSALHAMAEARKKEREEWTRAVGGLRQEIAAIAQSQPGLAEEVEKRLLELQQTIAALQREQASRLQALSASAQEEWARALRGMEQERLRETARLGELAGGLQGELSKLAAQVEPLQAEVAAAGEAGTRGREEAARLGEQIAGLRAELREAMKDRGLEQEGRNQALDGVKQQMDALQQRLSDLDSKLTQMGKTPSVPGPEFLEWKERTENLKATLETGLSGDREALKALQEEMRAAARARAQERENLLGTAAGLREETKTLREKLGEFGEALRSLEARQAEVPALFREAQQRLENERAGQTQTADQLKLQMDHIQGQMAEVARGLAGLDQRVQDPGPPLEQLRGHIQAQTDALRTGLVETSRQVALLGETVQGSGPQLQGLRDQALQLQTALQQMAREDAGHAQAIEGLRQEMAALTASTREERARVLKEMEAHHLQATAGLREHIAALETGLGRLGARLEDLQSGLANSIQEAKEETSGFRAQMEKERAEQAQAMEQQRLHLEHLRGQLAEVARGLSGLDQTVQSSGSRFDGLQEYIAAVEKGLHALTDTGLDAARRSSRLSEEQQHLREAIERLQAESKAALDAGSEEQKAMIRAMEGALRSLEEQQANVPTVYQKAQQTYQEAQQRLEHLLQEMGRERAAQARSMDEVKVQMREHIATIQTETNAAREAGAKGREEAALALSDLRKETAAIQESSKARAAEAEMMLLRVQREVAALPEKQAARLGEQVEPLRGHLSEMARRLGGLEESVQVSAPQIDQLREHIQEVEKGLRTLTITLGETAQEQRASRELLEGLQTTSQAAVEQQAREWTQAHQGAREETQRLRAHMETQTDALRTGLVETSRQVALLGETVQGSGPQLQGLRDQVDGLGKSLHALSTSVADTTQRHTQLAPELQRQREHIAAVQEALGARAAEVEKGLLELQREVAALPEKQAARLGEQVEPLRGHLSEIEESLRSLEAHRAEDAALFREARHGLEEEMAGQARGLEEFGAQMETLVPLIAGIQSTLGRIAGEGMERARATEGVRARVEAVEARLAEERHALQAQMSRLEEALSSIEARQEEARQGWEEERAGQARAVDQVKVQVEALQGQMAGVARGLAGLEQLREHTQGVEKGLRALALTQGDTVQQAARLSGEQVASRQLLEKLREQTTALSGQLSGLQKSVEDHPGEHEVVRGALGRVSEEQEAARELLEALQGDTTRFSKAVPGLLAEAAEAGKRAAALERGMQDLHGLLEALRREGEERERARMREEASRAREHTREMARAGSERLKRLQEMALRIQGQQEGEEPPPPG